MAFHLSCIQRFVVLQSGAFSPLVTYHSLLVASWASRQFDLRTWIKNIRVLSLSHMTNFFSPTARREDAEICPQAVSISKKTMNLIFLSVLFF